jgi:hypothetical protein
VTRTGQLELGFALDAALERAGREWIGQARRVMGELCRFGVSFSADDVVAAVGLPPGKSHAALGAVFNQAAREGWIVEAGSCRSSRPDRHGGRIVTWKAAS